MTNPVVILTDPERVERPLYAARLCVRGEGPVGNDPTGPKWIWDTEGDGIVLGKGSPFRATGPRLFDIGLIKGRGFKGGTALSVLAENLGERSGEGVYEGLQILGESDLDGSLQANWARGIWVCGKNLRAINAAGSRVNRFRRCRIAGVEEAIVLENAVHCWVTETQVDPGKPAGIPVVRINGGDHVFLCDNNITGRIIVEGNASNVTIRGFAQEIILRSGCRNITIDGVVERRLIIEPNVTGHCRAFVTGPITDDAKDFHVWRPGQ